jgi:putative spermidine/putrescine transport system permease protein
MASTRISRDAVSAAGHAIPAWPVPRVLPWLKKQLVDWLPALPLILLALALLIVPTVMVVAQSLRDDTGAWTLRVWAETLQRRGDQRAIVTSLALGVVCATVSILVGAPVAWFLARATTMMRASWLSLLNVGANFSGIGLAFGFIASLGTYGMVTLLLQGAGIAIAPPSPASFVGLAIGYVYTNVPLFVLLTLPAMGVVQRDSMEAAAVLGASGLEFWRFIGLPVLAPFLAAGWLLIFTWSIGIYGLAYALAGNAATSQLRLMTLQIGVSLNSAASSQERAAVMATLLLLIATVSLVAYRLAVRKAVQWVD